MAVHLSETIQFRVHRNQIRTVRVRGRNQVSIVAGRQWPVITDTGLTGQWRTSGNIFQGTCQFIVPLRRANHHRLILLQRCLCQTVSAGLLT